MMSAGAFANRYDTDAAWDAVRGLGYFDNGNSRTNMLYWTATRPQRSEESEESEKSVKSEKSEKSVVALGVHSSPGENATPSPAAARAEADEERRRQGGGKADAGWGAFAALGLALGAVLGGGAWLLLASRGFVWCAKKEESEEREESRSGDGAGGQPYHLMPAGEE